MAGKCTLATALHINCFKNVCKRTPKRNGTGISKIFSEQLFSRTSVTKSAFSKVAYLQSAALLKLDSGMGFFLETVMEFPKANISENTLGSLLLMLVARRENELLHERF